MEKEKNKLPTINTILEKVIDADLYEKYRRNLGFSITPDYLYQWALISLNENNSDKAISFIISSLDIDRKHAPTLHLLKSLIIGISKDFYENGGSRYKESFESFEDAILAVKRRALVVKKKIEQLKLEISSLQSSLNSGFAPIKFLKKFQREKDLIAIKNKLMENQYRLDNFKKEIKKIRRFQKNEEYSKILGTILEICIMPKKYNSTQNTKDY